MTRIVALVACVVVLIGVRPLESISIKGSDPSSNFAQRAGGSPSARAAAPVDLTGIWVAVVTEDWQWRMQTPQPGDVTSVPVNPLGRKVAASWTPAQDGRCEAYGVGGLMRMPGRLRISWQDDFTLKIESDAGQQTRLLHFAKPGAPLTTAPSTFTPRLSSRW